jgi:hypothetical protein
LEIVVPPPVGEPVDEGADQEMGPRLPGGAEQLEDVGPAVADMDTAGRIAQQLGRLPQVPQP